MPRSVKRAYKVRRSLEGAATLTFDQKMKWPTKKSDREVLSDDWNAIRKDMSVTIRKAASELQSA